MRIAEIEKTVRNGFANEELKARIINEGPVALSEILSEIKAREAARTLSNRVTELESELVVQRASNAWM